MIRSSIILPRRYRVEFAPIEPVRLSRFARIAWRACLAGAIALAVAVVVAVTVGDAAPTPIVTAFPAILRPADVRPWMRSPLVGIVQPRWIEGPSANVSR